MRCQIVKKLRAITLSALCLLLSFQINHSVAVIDLTPQLKKPIAEQIIEYEDYIYQHHSVSGLSPLAARKKYGNENKKRIMYSI